MLNQRPAMAWINSIHNLSLTKSRSIHLSRIWRSSACPPHTCHSSWLPIFSYCSPALADLARCPVAVKFINTRRIREIRFPLRCPLRLEALLTRRIFRHYLCHLTPLTPTPYSQLSKGFPSPLTSFWHFACFVSLWGYLYSKMAVIVCAVVLARTRLDSSQEQQREREREQRTWNYSQVLILSGIRR